MRHLCHQAAPDTALSRTLNKQLDTTRRGNSRYRAQWDVLPSQLLPSCIYTLFAFSSLFFLVMTNEDAWGSYPLCQLMSASRVPPHSTRQLSAHFGGEENKYRTRFPPPSPLGFRLGLADARQGPGWWGELLQVICTSKAAFASDPLSPCEQGVARFNCSFKGSPGLVSAEILGLTLPPRLP